jgi:hypothetical protein
MKKPNKRRERRAADFPDKRKAPKPVLKKKPTKTVRRKAASLLKSLPDVTVERRPAFVPRKHYFIGGGTVQHLQIPSGWQLSTSPRPEGVRLVGVKVFRTLPHGETVKLYRFVVRDDIRAELAAKAAALVAAVRAEDNAAIVQRERRTLRVRGTRCPRR